MATPKPGFFAELKRRNVLRAAVLYAGGAWALAQGIAQLGPLFDAPTWAMRAFVIACVAGFPFWVAFAWAFAWTPEGFKREEEVERSVALTRAAGRKLDFWIIGVLLVAVALLASGYFVQRVTSATSVIAASVIPAQSIAVLPFENLSDDRNNAYFVAGMQDLILTKLADIGGLKVIARTSTRQFSSRPEHLAQIGQQLGVATILEGSVQKQGAQVLINVQLIDAQTDSHIWAESYTRTLTDVFGIEGEVATQIAASLNAKLSPAQAAQLAATPTTNVAAYDAFLHAEYLVDQGLVNGDTARWKAALPLYRQAITADPKCTLAFARLSIAESRLAFNSNGKDAAQLNQQARANANLALRLQPDLPMAQLALGYYDYWARRDYPGALTAFAAVLKLRPNDAEALAAQGYVQRREGRIGPAIASLTRAVALDPRSFTPTYELGNTCMMASRYREAEQWFQRALALAPDSTNAKTSYASAILYGSGDIPRALAVIPGDTPELKAQRAALLVYQRRFPEAIALLESIPDTTDNFPLGHSKSYALAYALLQAGDLDRAGRLFAQALPGDEAASAGTQGFDAVDFLQSVALDQIGSGHSAAGLAVLAKSEATLDRAHDALMIPGFREFDASVYSLAARADLAVPLLDRALATPGIGMNYSPVMLWLDPVWDPIRRAPVFQALLKKYARYKPAVTYVGPPAPSAAVR
jgi:TolB-like protein/Flp pilus assembly protein TadD